MQQQLGRLRGRVAGLARAGDRERAARDELRFAVGALHARTARDRPATRPVDAEFKVFSQFGEDGIIQHLLRHTEVSTELFVEFGVQDYRESNTRFLLMHDNWRGIIVDSGDDHIRFVEGSDIGWRHTIDAVQAFITTENVDDLLPDEPIGLLSIDIDGNDYWVWEATEAVPEIVVVEYNSLFGPSEAVAVPYDPTFAIGRAHWSHQYYGASLAAFDHLARRKGYALVGGTSQGVNAFFVREDRLGSIEPMSVEEAWRPIRARTSRDEEGNPTYLNGHRDRLAPIVGLPLVDVATGEACSVQLSLAADAGR